MKLKMMNTTLVMAAFGLFLFSCGSGSDSASESTDATIDVAEDLSGSFNLDTEESTLNWTGHMLKIGGVSLYNHHGNLDFEKGRLVVENGRVVEGTFVVDMQSIVPTDENYSPDSEESGRRADLVNHLASDDFFSIETYPTATLEITGMEGDDITGIMTIRGKSNPVVISDYTLNVDGDVVRASGNLTLDRQQYEVAFEMGAQDRVLSDDLDLEFSVVLNKASDDV